MSAVCLVLIGTTYVVGSLAAAGRLPQYGWVVALCGAGLGALAIVAGCLVRDRSPFALAGVAVVGVGGGASLVGLLWLGRPLAACALIGPLIAAVLLAVVQLRRSAVARDDVTPE